MPKMSKPATIALWLGEASLWIDETADHDITNRHRRMMEAIDIAQEHYEKVSKDKTERLSHLLRTNLTP